MFTKAPWEVIGGCLEGNYNMGGSTTYEVPSMQDIADQTNIDEQATAGFRHSRNELGKIQSGETRPNMSGFQEVVNIVDHNLGEVTNFLAGDPRGYNKRQQQKREQQKAQEEAALAAKAAGQTYGQEGKKKKKKKGLLALSTPSAQAGRFRSGKRRFRVRPTGATGVNVAGSGGGSTVGTS